VVFKRGKFYSIGRRKKRTMGVKKLGPFLRKYNCCLEVTLENYRGKRVAVDAPIYLYRYMASKKHNFLEGFRHQLNDFAKYGIEAIYVFDGKPVNLKKDELVKRKKMKTKLKNDFNNPNLPFFKRVQAKERIASIPTHVDYDTLKSFLTDRAVAFHIAPTGDGEKLCAAFTRDHHNCHTVFSQDFDTLVYGAERLTTIRHDANGLLEYSWESIEKTFSWSRAQFIDFCLLCGTDFTRNLKHFGPARSKKLIDDHKRIENALQHLQETKIGFKVPSKEEFNYLEARKEFSLAEFPERAIARKNDVAVEQGDYGEARKKKK
jgi:flap endonuclease-1